jgi:hypothetical protein
MTISNNFGLTFNDKAFYDDVCKQLVKAVQAALDKLQNTMQAYSGESKISGAWMNVIKMAEGKIIGYVGNDHWWAFIDNFGSGSKLDKSNPWLQEYVESGFFNKERLDFDYAVVSRFGHYYSPDWIGGDGYKEHTGSGRRTVEGNPINLERLTNIKLGLKGSDDDLPKRLTNDLQIPTNKKSKVPLAKMRKRYYKSRSWDKNGVPTKGLIRRLGINKAGV